MNKLNSRTLLSPIYEKEKDFFSKSVEDIGSAIQDIIFGYLEENISNDESILERNNYIVTHALLRCLIAMGNACCDDRKKVKNELIQSIRDHYNYLKYKNPN